MDEAHARQAVALAERGLFSAAPNPRVGCVICKDGVVVAEGWHQKTGEAHAEIIALEQVGGDARGCDVYVSLEPCASVGRTPPCADALVAAQPARIFVAVLDPNPTTAGRGVARLRDAGIAVTVADACGELARAARRLNIGFFSRMLRGRPWLRLKIAASMDGKTALSSGLSQWITGEVARHDAHRLRARSCALLTGVGTALQDNPRLTVRDVETSRQPLRVLVDSQRRLPADYLMFADDNALVATATDATAANTNTPTVVFDDGNGRVDLQKLMHYLSAEKEINEITVEAGRKLCGAFLRAGLADEIVLYQSPRIIGQNGKAMFDFEAAADSLEQPPAFVLDSCETLSSGDIKTVYLLNSSLDFQNKK